MNDLVTSYSGTTYHYGGDYCTCNRCPCCGKLIAAPAYPVYPIWYYNPYWYLYSPVWSARGTVDVG